MITFGDVYRSVFNFVGYIDGEWRYINGVANIPTDIQENLDVNKYTYNDDHIVGAEDIVGEIDLYYFSIKSFNYPISPGDTGNSLDRQRANSVAQSLNHFFQTSKYLVMETTHSEFFPDLLNRIHFGRIWWDIKKDDIIWQI